MYWMERGTFARVGGGKSWPLDPARDRMARLFGLGFVFSGRPWQRLASFGNLRALSGRGRPSALIWVLLGNRDELRRGIGFVLARTPKTIGFVFPQGGQDHWVRLGFVEMDGFDCRKSFRKSELCRLALDPWGEFRTIWAGVRPRQCRGSRPDPRLWMSFFGDASGPRRDLGPAIRLNWASIRDRRE
jgi:hypothetical protein